MQVGHSGMAGERSEKPNHEGAVRTGQVATAVPGAGSFYGAPEVIFRLALERIASCWPECQDCEKRATFLQEGTGDHYFCQEHADSTIEYNKKLVSKGCRPEQPIKHWLPDHKILAAVEALDSAAALEKPAS